MVINYDFWIQSWKSTASGPAALNVIRISGDEAIKIVASIFKGPNLLLVENNTVNYGHIIDKNSVIDEVMASVFRRPRSFTSEDTVEITCHGGDFCGCRNHQAFD